MSLLFNWSRTADDRMDEERMEKLDLLIISGDVRIVGEVYRKGNMHYVDKLSNVCNKI